MVTVLPEPEYAKNKLPVVFPLIFNVVPTGTLKAVPAVLKVIVAEVAVAGVKETFVPVVAKAILFKVTPGTLETAILPPVLKITELPEHGLRQETGHQPPA